VRTFFGQRGRGFFRCGRPNFLLQKTSKIFEIYGVVYLIGVEGVGGTTAPRLEVFWANKSGTYPGKFETFRTNLKMKTFLRDHTNPWASAAGGRGP